MTQWPIDLLIQAAERYSIPFELGCYDPGEKTRKERLEARGWEPERVQTYLEYARNNHKVLLVEAHRTNKTIIEFVDPLEVARYLGYKV